MELRNLSYTDVLYVVRHMRDADRREIFATRWNDDPHELTEDCLRGGAFSWVCARDDIPICVVGASPTSPKVWNVWMFATDDFPKIKFSVTRHVRDVMMVNLVRSGADRAECLSIEGHEDAQKWLEYLGAVREASLLKRGRNGETFHVYAWIR